MFVCLFIWGWVVVYFAHFILRTTWKTKGLSNESSVPSLGLQRATTIRPPFSLEPQAYEPKLCFEAFKNHSTAPAREGCLRDFSGSTFGWLLYVPGHIKCFKWNASMLSSSKTSALRQMADIKYKMHLFLSYKLLVIDTLIYYQIENNVKLTSNVWVYVFKIKAN